MLGTRIGGPQCGVCAQPIARLEPMRRESKWTHGVDNGRAPKVTAQDRAANRVHEARP